MSLDDHSNVIANSQTRALHQRALVFDCLALLYVLDEPYTTRMKEGGVDAINLTVASEPESWDETLELTEKSLNKIEKNPDLLHATCARDIREAKKTGKIAVVLGTQGASMLDTHLWRFKILHRLGFRYFGPAYTGGTVFADGCGEFRNAGLSVLGKELIGLANELKMIIDLSHCSHQTRVEAAELANYPVCTHSNSFSINPNDRNTKDDAIKLIAKKGGVVGVCGLVKSVAPQNATLEHMLNHLDHLVRLVGYRHVGLGLDFTEGYQDAFRSGNASRDVVPKWRTIRPDIFGSPEEFFTLSYPKDIESITMLPNFTQGMRNRGYSEGEILGVLGENWLRHFETSVG